MTKPKIVENTAPASAPSYSKYQRYIELKAQKDALEKEMESLKKDMVDELHNRHAKGLTRGGILLLVEEATTSKKINYTLLEQKYPNVFKEVVTKQPGKRIVIK